jgi:hypothetical protein
VSSEFALVFSILKEHGLLLQTDANLPNVCASVAGAPVQGTVAGCSCNRPRSAWQMDRLSPEARKLLAEVDRKPVETDNRVSKPASEFETNLLVYSEQFHREAGAHARRLELWDHWSSRSGCAGEQIAAVRAELELETVVASLNRKFNGRGRLPWPRGRKS